MARGAGVRGVLSRGQLLQGGAHAARQAVRRQDGGLRVPTPEAVPEEVWQGAEATDARGEAGGSVGSTGAPYGSYP